MERILARQGLLPNPARQYACHRGNNEIASGDQIILSFRLIAIFAPKSARCELELWNRAEPMAVNPALDGKWTVIKGLMTTVRASIRNSLY